MNDTMRDIQEKILRRRERPMQATVTRGNGDMRAARIGGARNDLRSAQWDHDQAEARYESAKVDFLRTGEALDAAKARLAELEAEGAA